MKKVYLLLFVTFLSLNIFSQSLSFSTFREIYNFEVGDTFETSCGSHLTWLNPTNDIENMYLDIILSRQDLGDSVIYEIKRNNKYHWTDGIHNQYSTGTYTFFVVYTMLDSLVFWNHVHANLGCDSNHYCLFDSVYLDSNITTGKVNEHNWSDWGGGEDTIYADEIGLFAGGYGSEDPGVTQGGCNLRYYHKVNGKKWGYPYYFIVAGLNDLVEVIKVNLFPNPTTTSFTLQLSSAPKTQASFLLFDALGRQVMQQEIISETTTVNRGNLPNGIYFWQIQQANKIIDRGKIAVE